jgi:hypothetical protein
VPEATVYEDGESRPSEDDVYAARDVGLWARVLEKPVTTAM